MKEMMSLKIKSYEDRKTCRDGGTCPELMEKDSVTGEKQECVNGKLMLYFSRHEFCRHGQFVVVFLVYSMLRYCSQVLRQLQGAGANFFLPYMSSD